MAKPQRARGGQGRRGRSGDSQKLFAALDLGTNNCRLLIAQKAGDGLRIVDSYSQIVRLGEGLASSGQLSDAAMQRAVTALKRCVEKVNKHRPLQARYIATQACRAATNGQAFISSVRRETGLQLETISTKEEAKFALLGSLDLIDPSHDFALVIDIGGGSTELCWVDAKAAVARGVEGCAKRPPILGWTSLPLGVVTLAESFTDTENGWYDRMVTHVREKLSVIDAASRFGPLFAAGRGQLIGNSGTVTSLAGVHLRLDRYQRAAVDGLWMSREGAEEARRRLHDATREERAKEPCIGPERADLVLAGCAILDAVWSLWPAQRMKVGDRGLREGILLSMIHGAAPSKAKSRRRKPRDHASRLTAATPAGQPAASASGAVSGTGTEP